MTAELDQLVLDAHRAQARLDAFIRERNRAALRTAVAEALSAAWRADR